MKIVKTIDEVREQVLTWKKEGLRIGFVPTMGFLHEGHISLVEASNKECDKTVASIFVNPTQFAPNEDLESYPRDFQRDCSLLESAKCDLLFAPEVSEMYDSNFATSIQITSQMPKQLCGKSRPTHFAGVCTVVAKLFNIVSPHKAFFGQKDAQQVIVIKQLVRDLSIDVEIIACPIIREEDGLAKSSRNTYLNPSERKSALVLSKSLTLAKKMIAENEKSSAVIISKMKEIIEQEKVAKIDYISIVDAVNLEDIAVIEKDALIALAVFIGKTRLIDNTLIKK